MEYEIEQRALDWRKNEAPKIDSAFAIGYSGDEQRAKLRRKRPYAGDVIKSALDHYKKSEKHCSLEFDPDTCTLRDVIRLQADAHAQYIEQEKKGIWAPIRKAFRIMGDKSEYVELVLDHIPDDLWGKALRMSLGWMFSLVKNVAKKRQTILQTFADIPDIIMVVEARGKHFFADACAMELVDNVYDSILKATIRFITFLLEGNPLKKAFPILSGMPSENDIAELITQIKRALDALDKKSDILREGILIETRDLVLKRTDMIQSEVHAVRQTVLDVRHKVSEMDIFHRQSNQEILDAIASKEHNIVREVQDSERRCEEYSNKASQATTNMLLDYIKLFKDEVRESVEVGMLERARTPRLFLVEAPVLSISELQSIIRAPLQSITQDFEHALRYGLQFGHFQQGQLQWILQHERFSQWFRPGYSDILLTYLDLSDDSGRVSSLSVVCSTVMASLSQTIPGVIGLYYFCGLHQSFDDDLRGPQGLMRCLVARLLLELDVSSGLSPKFGCADLHFLEGLRRWDARSLCELFSSIVMQFTPDTTIYLMIDGITWYERDEMLDGLLQVIDTLCGLYDGQSARCLLKVLITSPFRPQHHLSSRIPAAHTMEVPREPSMLAPDLGVISDRMYGRLDRSED